MQESPKDQAARETAEFLKASRPRRPGGDNCRPDSYQIQSVPRGDYRPAPWVVKTSSLALDGELGKLLEQMWELNEQHVGEDVNVVGVFCALTGEHEALSRSLREWVGRYLAGRLAKCNPADDDDPLKTFERLLSECIKALGNREGTVDYLVADESICFAAWKLYESTWKNSVTLNVNDYVIEVCGGPHVRRLAGWLQHQIASFGFGRNNLESFLRAIAKYGDQQRLRDYETTGDVALLEAANSMVEDIQEVRPVLLRNFNPRKSVVPQTDEFAIACDWVARHGIIDVLVGRGERGLSENLQTHRSLWNVVLRRDGLIIDGDRPWISVRDIEEQGEFSSLAINAYVVELLHTKLFSFYERVRFDRFWRPTEPGREPVAEESEDEQVALLCHEIARREDEHDLQRGTLARPRRCVRSLRTKQFLKILKRLGCEVHPGKGDEISLYRHGGKKFRHGGHKETHATDVVIILKRLGISDQEFLREANR
jgi:hypothetical protein